MSFEGFNILSLMQRWSSKREMMGDDPPYLAVGTEVSAKYKGAFCEAKVRKIVRSVKCKVAYKLGPGTSTVTDDQIKGPLRAGSVVEVKHPEKKENVEATIIKIQDCSQYTVVFDDGDITTLRRTALCLKSGRHFAESETLDQLPLTHPEHFGNPVIGGRRGRRNRHDDSSDDEELSKKAKQAKEEKEEDIGKVVCVEISEKKKQKDNWFPGLVVAPTAVQDTVKINAKDDYLVRSFKDGRYYTVPKKEATAFTREIGLKVDNNNLKTAVEKALLFLDRDELPPHWDRELLFEPNDMSDSDSDAAIDSDTSDDEPREEKDHFVAQLYKFMDDRGTPINKGPTINGRDVDLYKLFKVVHKLGGYNRVTNHNQWKTVSHKLGFGHNPTSVNLVKHAYKKFLHSFEDFYRKLGCTMVNHPRGQRSRHRGSNRSLIRDKDKALPSKETKGENDDIKDDASVDSKEGSSKEEPQTKEVPFESLKPQRESRKDCQKLKTEKIDKKDDVKLIPLISKGSDTSSVKVLKDDKTKSDDREERLKLREMVKLDVNAKEEVKADKDSLKSKDLKNEEIQRLSKLTRREVKDSSKKDEKEDKVKNCNERDIRQKKPSSNLEATSSEQSKVKKSRSLFSKITGSKRVKPVRESKILRTNKPQGLNATRQKRTFSERMKAMVKKFKIGSGVKLRHKSPLPAEAKVAEDKKKQNTEESSKVIIPQLTRSKSKEEVSSKLRKPDVNNDKKAAGPSSMNEKKLTATAHVEKKPTQTSAVDKKQAMPKKRKEDDAKPVISDEGLDQLPTYKSVGVGDKLKVYYGPTHESKVTYEAKVLSTKEENHETMYLVHYTGWNTRYDEWIRRSRIADNLSWTPGRVKRMRQNQMQLPQNRITKRSKSGEKAGSARSTTPSSVTSSSSRQRNVRSRGRTRRASGHTHTDFSDSEMDDDSDSDETDTPQVPGSKDSDHKLSSDERDMRELLVSRTRRRRRRLESGCDSEDTSVKDLEIKARKNKDGAEEDEKVERTRSRSEKRKFDEISKGVVASDAKKDGSDSYVSDRLRVKKKLLEEKTDSGDEKDGKQNNKTDDSMNKVQPSNTDSKHSDSEIQEVDSKKKLKQKVDECLVNEASKEPQLSERRRSRRVTPRKEELSAKKVEPKCVEDQPRGREFDLNQIRSELKGINHAGKSCKEVSNVVNDPEEPSDKEEDSVKIKLEDGAPEDIYEFKEPEPFEFEVRSKCGDDKGGKIQRRTFGRMCEDTSLSSVAARKKIILMPAELQSSENIRNVNSVTKEEAVDVKSETVLDISNVKELSSFNPKKGVQCFSPQQKQKDDDQEKLKEFQIKKEIDKTNDDLQPLSLFSDLPEDDTGMNEDSNEPLVLSDTESEADHNGPLFSHQQRDHEDFFPTSVTQSSSLDDSQNKSPFSGFTDKLKEDESESEDNSKKDDDEDDDIEDDPILSAIQRVQRACSQSTGDEDSNGIDLLTEIQDPTHKNDDENVISELKGNDSNNSHASKEGSESQNIENPEAQTSQSNQSLESDDENIGMRQCKIIEEINLDSNDSDVNENVDKEISEDEDDSESIQLIGLKDEVAKTKELLDSFTMDKSEKNEKEEIIEIGKNDNDDLESDKEESEVKEEVVEDSQESETEPELKVDESEEQVELDETIVLESEIEVKKEQSNENEVSVNVEKTEIVEELKLEEPKGDSREVEEPENNLDGLLCEETIPGSPAPATAPVDNPPASTSPELPFASAAGAHAVAYKAPALPPPLPPPPPPLPHPAVNEAAPVMENTPPTTPESSLSPISNSPRGERSGSSPVPENESSKSNRDSSEVETEGFQRKPKIDHFSEEDTSLMEGNAAPNLNTSLKKAGPSEEMAPQGIKRRRRSHKRSEENAKRIKLSHRSPRHNNGSESDDDTSENSLDLLSLHTRSPKPSKYNFFVQLDPELDASQRIAVLQQRLSELRKTYSSVKAELACIDRRRKKLRRRERDSSVKSSVKPEVPCS